MKNFGVNIVVGLGATALAGAAIMGMSGSGGSKGGRAHKDELAPAIETLQKQLTRRFTERTNVDFGFSRVTRPGSRIHMGPVMGRLGPMDDIKSEGGKMLAMDPSGQWKPIETYRDEMHAENDQEKAAIQAILASHRDVGIYTFGRFDASVAEQRRAKGPAILNQFSSPPPTAASISDFATRAWRSGTTSSHAIVNGWALYAMRVDAADQSCVACHQSMAATPAEKAKYKLGDRIGMFIIAVQEPNTPILHG